MKAKTEYDMKYQKENITRVAFALNRRNDADIIDKLNSVPNKNEYLKNLIRQDIIK